MAWVGQICLRAPHSMSIASVMTPLLRLADGQDPRSGHAATVWRVHSGLDRYGGKSLRFLFSLMHAHRDAIVILVDDVLWLNRNTEEPAISGRGAHAR